MKLVYRLLSEDLIENLGVVENCADSGFAEKELCRRIETATGIEGELIRKTVGDFIEKGYLCAMFSEDSFVWCWTHNNQNKFESQETVVGG
ncbi:MAG: hypothetical protein M0P74_15755 [Syntrophales bacterium]|jgi:hypothetical protein|nr:hypothetical protein [Syntrophales bacterium]